jgi:hypothetical protein
MSKPKKNDLASKALKCIKAKESGKRAYARADRLLAEIAKAIKPGEEIVLNDAGRKAVLKDRFDGKDIVWTPCAARRWELEVIEP